MKNVMTYENYSALVEFDPEDHILVGRIAGIDDIVTFHGESVKELEIAFKEAVDHYLEASEKMGRPAQKPYSGKFMLRLGPELHSKAAIAAEIAGKSLNQWISEILYNQTNSLKS